MGKPLMQHGRLADLLDEAKSKSTPEQSEIICLEPEFRFSSNAPMAFVREGTCNVSTG
jgi:hypothetical protein